MSSLSNELLPQSVVGLVADPAVQGACRATGVAGSDAAMAPDPEVAAVADPVGHPPKRLPLDQRKTTRSPGSATLPTARGTGSLWPVEGRFGRGFDSPVSLK